MHVQSWSHRALGLGCLVWLLGTGCFVDQVDEAANLACTDPSECPQTHVCAATVGRCVRRDSATPARVERALRGSPAGFGAIVELDVSVSGALANDPVVHVGDRLSLDRPDEAATDRQAGRFRYIIAVGAGLEEGRHLVTIDLVGAAGQSIPGQTIGDLVIDLTTPVATRVDVSSAV